jgi:hypothetical protein
MLPLLGFLKAFLKVFSIVFLDSQGIIIESVIQLVTDKTILIIGHSFKLMKPHCIRVALTISDHTMPMVSTVLIHQIKLLNQPCIFAVYMAHMKSSSSFRFL